ncbi:MAG: DUF4162 domain-containing protein [Armatimonadetes bacterium]|nr:DUF4162 domain-containing protein [Armatimonadota bacterium]
MSIATEGTELLDTIVKRLLEVDGKIRSISLIGSFAWFPELARDVDIVVITESELPCDAYWEAISDLPKPVDIVVFRRGERAKGLALALRAGVLLWGDVDDILRQLQPARLLTIRCLDGVEKLAEWLSKQPEIVNVQVVNSTVEAQFVGDDDAQAELLKRIILDGHRIAAFSETTMNLEDVFLRVTKGEVA